MKAVQRQIGLVILFSSCAVAQGIPATLRDVTVIPESGGVQIEVALSAGVKPSVLATTNPFRLVLDFANTIPASRQQVGVNVQGVRAVRYALYQSSPPVTRVVVDLDQAHSYELRSDGNRVTLIVGPPVAAGVARRHVPAPAGSEGLLGILRPHGRSAPVPSSDDGLNRPYPPPVAASAPTAAHPNRGSLQEGTVFPGLGSPGTGNVPGGTGSATASAASPVAPVKTASDAEAPSTPPASGPGAPSSIASSSAPATAAPPTAASKNDSLPGVVTSPAAPAPSQVLRTADQEATKRPSASQPSAEAPSNPAGPSSQTTSASVPEGSNPIPSSSTTVQAAAPAAASGNDAKPSAPASSVNPPPSEVPRAAEQDASAAASTAQAEPPDVTPSNSDSTDSAAGLPALDPNLKTVFKVKYVAEGAAYLDGGRSSGLTEGMKLEVKESDLPAQQGSTASVGDPRVVAELEVVAVTETSAVTDIHVPKRPVKPGDLAYLSTGDAQALIQQRTLSSTRKYPMVVAFTEDDPQDEEVRAEVPRPPQPSVNRTRGWIGLDHMGTVSHGSSPVTSSDVGLVVRADITRIGGSYWNLTGYWRGRLSSRSSSTQPTLQDLINRTYHLGLIYDNPNSRWVAGVGRLYLPWAPSLDTIDGGYFGMRLGRGATAGLFAGSTPDPTSWNYSPDRRIAGSFINFQGGSYDRFYYTSTSGLGVSTLKWQIDRPFVFFENSVSYKRFVSIYDSLQADSPRGNQAVPAPGPGLSRNFLTVRLQVHPRLEIDLNHNYFRDIPTFDPALIGTGLLDKYLFQGFSVGARAEIVKQVFLYGDVGRSNRTGDAKNSWNQMAGISFNHLPWFGLRADAHYSRFNSSFGDGSYKSFSVSREVTDTLLLSILAGTQSYSSTLASNNNSRFLNGNAEWSFGTHYFMQGGFTINRGGALSYDQWLFTLGYRFDSKAKHK